MFANESVIGWLWNQIIPSWWTAWSMYGARSLKQNLLIAKQSLLIIQVCKRLSCHLNGKQSVSSEADWNSVSSYLEQNDEGESCSQDTPVLFGERVRIRGPGGLPVVFVPRTNHTDHQQIYKLINTEFREGTARNGKTAVSPLLSNHLFIPPRFSLPVWGSCSLKYNNLAL